MKTKITLVLALLTAKTLVSQNTRQAPSYFQILAPSLSYVDVNKDRVISLDEARVVFEKYQKCNVNTAAGDSTETIESTLIDLITYLEGINCNDIKKSIASKRFIQIYYANKFFDRREDPFGLTMESLKH